MKLNEIINSLKNNKVNEIINLLENATIDELIELKRDVKERICKKITDEKIY